VILDNGRVFFGKLSESAINYRVLTDVFYESRRSGDKGRLQYSDQAASGVAKTRCDVHQFVSLLRMNLVYTTVTNNEKRAQK
jgi:hypothetical protein